MTKKKPSRNIVQEFADYFGSESKLANWQRLCYDLDIFDDVGSITKCKNVRNSPFPSNYPLKTLLACKRHFANHFPCQALKRVHVNIHDLIDAKRNGTAVRQFKNHKQLIEYTQNNHRFYPKKKAKEGGPVRLLLRQFF